MSNDDESRGVDSARFAATLAALPVPILVMSAVRDDDGEIIDLRHDYVNAAAADRMGLQPGNVIGTRLLELFPSHRDLDLFAAYCRVISAREPAMIEVPWFTEGKLVGAWEVSLTPLDDGLVALLHNVSERAAHANELLEREAMFRLLADHTADAILLSRGRIIEWVSPTATAALGWRPDELTGRRTDWFVHVDDQPEMFRLGGELTGAASRRFRGRVRRPDGSWRWFDFFGRRVDDSDGPDGRQFVTVLLDVQAEVEALEALERAERDRREIERRMQHAQRLESLGLFAGGIAHDFNNLITVIQGHAGLARESRTDPAAVDAHLQRVELAVRSAAELTGQLLDYAGKREHQPDYVDLGGVVDDARVMLTSWWPADVRLDLDIDEGSIVLADRTRLRQVVLNLLQNAAQACIGADAAVAVSLRRDDRNHETVLTVADTGVGIPADTIDRIFDPFFTTKTDGHGLGLSVVHGIIDSIQGVVNVTSVPAHGTTFTITLPLAADARSGDPLRSG